MTYLFRPGFWATALFLVPAGYAWAEKDEADDEEGTLDTASVFVELNAGDDVLGIHALIDGDDWKALKIKDPNDRPLLKIRAKGPFRKQGLTEVFFETGERDFDVLTPEAFFQRFPEGTYEVEALTLEGEKLENEVEVTHIIPNPAQPSVNGIPLVEDCDEGEVPVFSADEPIVITWPPVTTSHPEYGRTNEPIEVVNYEVGIEIEETSYSSSASLPPDAGSYLVPPEMLAFGGEIKYEVLVREAGRNQTATESCFEVE